MCSHYQAAKIAARLLRHFRVHGRDDLFRDDIWPGYLAPFIRRIDSLGHDRELLTGQFGLLPHWAKDATFGRRTYNARTETVAEKPAFRDAWKRGHRCIIPAEAIFEPSWETGKAVPWRISRADGEPMGIAGLWSVWRTPSGEQIPSMTMLTVNADSHSLMRRFHRPEDEKRMVVILDEADYDRWLDCPFEHMPAMMRQFPAELLTAVAAPLPPRAKKAQPTSVVEDDQSKLL